jgi:hypothetical protein
MNSQVKISLLSATLAFNLYAGPGRAADDELVRRAIRQNDAAQSQLSIVAGQLFQLGFPQQASAVNAANARVRESSRLLRNALTAQPPTCQEPEPAPPTYRSCEIYGPGIHNGLSWSYRIGYRGKITGATNSLDSAINELTNLETAGLCEKAGVTCRLAGPGLHGGLSWTYRLNSGTAAGNGNIFAVNGFETFLATYDRLARERVCAAERKACDLEGPGLFAGLSYSSRLSVDGIIVFASNNQSTVLEALQSLRQRNFCW